MNPTRRRAATVALLLALGALLNAPYLAQPPFHGEESRRALPAREMLASGDFLLPTIWGRPYLNKPPGHFWLVAGFARLRGAADEWSTRLPSALATVATGVALYLFGAAVWGEAAGALAGALFLLSVNVLGKGQVGEIEPPFALAVLGSVLLLWRGRDGRWPALLGGGACLALALLLKGPPALLFFVAAGLATAWAGGRPRFAMSARFWLPLGLGLLPVLAWAALLLASPHADAALDTWWAETSRTGGRSREGAFWLDRPRFLLGALGAYLPSALLLAASAGTDTGRRLWREPLFRFLLVTMALSFAYFLVTPGPRPRYVYPLVGLCALAAAAVATRAGEDPTLRRRLRVLVGIGLVAALATACAGFAPLLRPVAGLDGLSAAGVALLLATLAAAGVGLAAWWRGSDARALILALAGLALLGGFRAAELRPQLQGDRAVVARMRALEDPAPAGAPLPFRVVAMWNELVYLERPLVWTDEPSAAEPGSLLLIDAEARRQLAAERALEELAHQEIRGRRRLSLVRVGGTPAGADSPAAPTGPTPAGRRRHVPAPAPPAAGPR